MSAPTDHEDEPTGRPVGEGDRRALVLVDGPRPLLKVVDFSLGAGAAAVTVGQRVVGVAAVVTRPVVGLVMSPPFVPRSWTPGAALSRITRRGAATRVRAGAEVEVVSRALIPAVTDVVLDRIDLTELVLTRVDLARVVEGVLDRIDLTALVLDRVDIDRLVASADLDAAASQLDVDAVAARLDVDAVAARLDVDAVAKRLDVDAVAAQMDLVGIATYVVDAIDLPEIIRSSTGSVATEAVRGVRMQSVEADAQLQSVVDRVLLRRRGRRTEVTDGSEADES